MKKIYLYLIFIFSISQLLAQTGVPFITNYEPHEFGGSGQIWSIVQDNRGIMYFGGNANIFQFDGVNWTPLLNPNNSLTARSMVCDKNGTIYVGAVGDIGYLKPVGNGKLEYISLKNEINLDYQQFTDVWTAGRVGDNLYFCSEKYLFRYNTDSVPHFKVIEEGTHYHLTYQVNNELFVSITDYGIKKISGDKLIDVPQGTKIHPLFMLPYDNNKYLIDFQNKELFIYDPNNSDTSKILTKSYFNKKEIAKTDSIINKKLLYLGATVLSNGNYALSTILGGILIIDKTGKIVNIIDKQHNLLSQTVHVLFKDNQNQLWAGLTYGISHLEVNSPFRYFDDRFGLNGSIYNAFRCNNIFYANSNVGIFYFDKNKFVEIPELNGLQVFDPVTIKHPNSNKKMFLVSTINGMYKIENKTVTKINEELPNTVNQSQFDSTVIWSILDYYFLKFSINDELSKADTIFSFDFIPYAFCEKDKENIWILGDNDIILLNTNTKDTSNFYKYKPQNIDFYDVMNINNQIKFYSNNGFYIFDNQSNKFIPENLFVDDKSENLGIIKFEKISNIEYWLLFENNNKLSIGILKKFKDTFKIDSNIFKRLPEFDDFFADGDSIMWIISPNKLFSFDNKDYKIDSFVPNLLIRKVMCGDSVIFAGNFSDNNIIIKNQPSNFNIKLNYKHNNITFYYTLLDYNITKRNEYSYFLNGIQNKWSNWTNETYKEFTNLREGEYIFKVKARNVYDFESKITEIKFTILPPWYRTPFAYIVYLFLLIFIIWLSIKIYSVKLKRENDNLEKIVTERTAEINVQKEEIKTQSENLEKINTQLSEQNHEINQQNEEITAIAESLKQANTVITEKNKYITDSINYAQKIQLAVLPETDYILSVLPEHFILYMPKDIISGDFYWLKQINNHLLIVVADSTGHGVPGGFIGMLGISVLNEIVRKDKITNPAKALNDLRNIVKKSLSHGKKNSKNDGFDMAFVDINTENNELIFAGANIPLYIVRNNQLIEIKPVMNPIGIHPHEKPFYNNNFDLLKNDMIYLSTDGYKDQLNSKNEQFKIDKFKKLIIAISNTSMNNQKQSLKEEIIEWKGLKKQTDDILIFGFRWLK